MVAMVELVEGATEKEELRAGSAVGAVTAAVTAVAVTAAAATGKEAMAAAALEGAMAEVA